MKTLFLTAATVLFTTFSFSTHAQKLKEKQLMGVWMMKIEINEETWEKEAQDEENALARAFVKGISGFVDGVLEEIDLKFEFLPDNEAKVSVTVLGEQEIEYTDWFINSNGELEIGDTDLYDSDSETVWRMEDGILVAYDKDGSYSADDDTLVYMVKL